MIVFNVVLILSLTASSILGAGLRETPKSRRAGSMTLYPFPRVGRSNPEKTWLLPENLEDNPSELKSSNLMPYLRFGRAMYEQYGSKRANEVGTGGMWFGPRLGRFSKKSVQGFIDEDIIRKISNDFTPRLGREEEIYEDNEDFDHELYRQKRKAA